MNAKRAHTFFSLSPNLLCTANTATHQFMDLSPAWEHVLGWTIEELTSQPFLEFVHIDDQKATHAEVNRLVENEENQTLNFENRCRHKDGSWVWLSWTAHVKDGIYYAVAQEIKAYIDLREQLAQAREAHKRFTRTAAHDLKEPLRKIISFALLLEEDAEDGLPEEAKRDVHYMVDGAKRMGKLVSKTLELACSQSEPLTIQPTPLSACLSEALEELSEHIAETNAQIESVALPVVMGDQLALSRIFTNLLSNALKFSKKQHPPQIDIQAHYQESDGFWLISVADNGIGFDPKFAERIFKDFNRLHGRSVYEGSGLGLNLCETIIERHGGRIWAEGKIDAGATFYFTLKGPPRPSQKDESPNERR